MEAGSMEVMPRFMEVVLVSTESSLSSPSLAAERPRETSLGFPIMPPCENTPARDSDLEVFDLAVIMR
jgi:hypothetical protein